MSCNPSIPSEESSSLLGLVLCGGKSSRMGADKGLLKTKGQTWSEIAYHKLLELDIPVCLSINFSQKEEYSKIFEEGLLIEDCMKIEGPLEGLMSVHNTFPESDILVLACDLPDLDSSTITELKSLYEEKSGEHDFFVYTREGELEPLLGIYTAEGLQKVFSLLITHQLEKKSMKHILEISNTYSQELSTEKLKEFKNYNEKGDLS